MQRRDFLRTVLGTATLLAGAGETHAARAAQRSQPDASAGTSAIPIHDQVHWAQFLARHDLVWERLPSKWTEGAFIGNGLLGSMIFTQDGALRWDVGRSDVCDHQTPTEGRGHNLGGYYRARLYIGHFLLKPTGKITGGAMRLTLWDAETTGTIQTDQGSIAWRAFVPTGENAIVLEFTTTGQEHQFTWEWNADVSSSPRKLFGRPGTPEDYLSNPPPTTTQAGDVHLCTQTMRAGGEYDTAWRDVSTAPNTRRITISVGYSPEDARARTEAVLSVQRASEHSLEQMAAAHRAWWHSYYPQSFLSIPDTRLESLYWIQMYKFASATRADRPAMDLYGPWLTTTAWPYTCWNMNEQVTYFPVYTANRLELGESLCRMLDDNTENLSLNVPPEYQSDCAAIFTATSHDCRGDVGPEIGNLPWALHNYWRQCRWAGDEARLRDKLYPVLKRAMTFYTRQLVQGDDGKLHLPTTTSPEYGPAPDCNYDLSLLRWGLGVLMETAEKWHLAEPQMDHWKQVLATLTDYPTDETGLMIGRGVPLAHAHRHFSHLLMIFPLRTMHWNQPENRALIQKSLTHWMTVPGPDRLGFTYLGAASICASIGQGTEALGYLNTALDHTIYPNTMYIEGCIESPFGMCESVQDMLLQSWGGTIHVFPGVPDAWEDVTFHQLRAEGAFLVSATRHAGQTQWIHIQSLVGEPCRLHPGLTGPVSFWRRGRQSRVTPEADGTLALSLAPGEIVVLFTGARPSALAVAPLAAQPGRTNYYGLRDAPPV